MSLSLENLKELVSEELHGKRKFRWVLTEVHKAEHSGGCEESHPDQSHEEWAESSAGSDLEYPGTVGHAGLEERVFPSRPAHREATPDDLAALKALENEPEDDEGRMATAQLGRAARDAEMISLLIRDQRQLPGWVQNKITLAAEYLEGVKNYIHSTRMELDENENNKS